MQQGIRALATCVALALVASVSAPLLAPCVQVAHAAAASSGSAGKKSPAAKSYQFTGVIVAMDKSTLTVEKGKAKPTRQVFSKHETMKVTGDIEKGTRVTVYYRKQGNRAIAHRVVAKDAASSKQG
jgi:hypothetical protein